MIPRKVQRFAAVAVAAFLVIWLYSRSRDARIRQEAVAKAEVTKLKSDLARADTVNALLRDSIHAVQAHTDTVRAATTVAAKSYERERSKIDTTHAAQPLGTPAGFVVVPVALIQTTDSLAALVPTLTAALDAERGVSARRIAALMQTDSLSRAINTRLQIQLKATKPRTSDKLKWVMIGVGGALGAVEIFKK